jgi:hypothetical protein
MSAAKVGSVPPMTSGAMYSGVPVTRSSALPGALTMRAMPKSTSLTRSVPARRWSMMMLSLLRSAWTTPARCASSMPSRIWATMSSAVAGAIGCSRPISCVSVGPRRYSMARYSRPSGVAP